MMTALAALKMASIRLSVQGVAAGGMSAWLADQAVMPARGAAKQVRYLANLAFLAVVKAVASRLKIQPVVEFLSSVEAELAMAADQSVEPQSVGPGRLERQATAAIPLRSHFLVAARPHSSTSHLRLAAFRVRLAGGEWMAAEMSLLVLLAALSLKLLALSLRMWQKVRVFVGDDDVGSRGAR
jgi:hypothetical protein